MEVYKNDYNKNEDYMLWELHEIRNKLSLQTPEQINNSGEKIIKKYNFKNIKIVDLQSESVT